MKFDNLTPEAAILTELGKRLAVFRKQQGYTQVQLAEEAGIGVATLRRIEGGQDSQMETWLKLMKALNNLPAIATFFPEQVKSPMEQAKAAAKAGKNKKSLSPTSQVWGDGKA